MERRTPSQVLLVTCVLGFALAQCHARGPASDSVRDAGVTGAGEQVADDGTLMGKLGQCAKDGKLHGLTVEYKWFGGMPPGYSKRLWLGALQSRDSVVYTYNEQTRDPPGDASWPFLKQRWEAAAAPELVVALAKAIVTAGVYQRHFAEEHPDHLVIDGAALKIVVSDGTRSEERVFFQKLPDALAPIGSATDTLIADVQARGTHTVLPWTPKSDDL